MELVTDTEKESGQHLTAAVDVLMHTIYIATRQSTTTTMQE
jgi:hypothetical protein